MNKLYEKHNNKLTDKILTLSQLLINKKNKFSK